MKMQGYHDGPCDDIAMCHSCAERERNFTGDKFSSDLRTANKDGMKIQSCECENANCDHENSCNRSAVKILNTIYGKFRMCETCAYRMPEKYLA